MSGGSWRDVAAPIIARVLKETAGQDEHEIRAALHGAYPFGERSMWPYKVWCDEVRRQRKHLPPKGTRKSARSLDTATKSLF